MDVNTTCFMSGKKYEQASCPVPLMRLRSVPWSVKVQVSAPPSVGFLRTASGSCTWAMTCRLSVA